MAEPLPQNSGAEALARAIISQAQDEAERLRQAARIEAEALVAQAEAEAAARLRVATERERIRSVEEKSRARASSKVEGRRRFLVAREKLIENVFFRAKEALATVRSQPRYSELLLELAREGMVNLTGEAFVLEVAPGDRSLVEALISSLVSEGKRVEVRAREGVDGGCVIWQHDRRAFYDNSFSGVLSRHREKLRPLIATWLLGDEWYWKE